MQELPWEDGLLERKVESDLRDLLKTLVAFANSVKPDHTAIILIGEKDDGTIAGVTNPDNIQKKIREECEKIYPDIVWRSKVYEKDGKHCVRVEIEYSGDTPHFGGPAWVRRGAVTVKATEDIFQKLIEVRSNLIRELTKWVGTLISVKMDIPMRWTGPLIQAFESVKMDYVRRWPLDEVVVTLVSVNNFWITVEDETGKKSSESIEKLSLSFDNERNQLTVLVKP